MKSIHRAYLDLIAAMTIVGSSVVVGKMIIGQIPIFMALTLRFMIALPILIGLSYRSGILAIPSKKILIRVFLQAFTGVFLSNVLMLMGLQYTSASQSGLLNGTTPAVITLLGWIFLRERLSRYEWIGVLLSASGVMVINLIGNTGDFTSGKSSLAGNGLVLAAVICEGLFTILRKTSKELPALSGAAWVTTFGLLLCLPVGIYQMATYDWHSLTVVEVAALIYYGGFVSVLGYFLWFRGVAHAPVGTAGILSSIIPLSALLLSIVLLGEIFTTAHLIGLMLILGAIGVITLGPYRAAKPVARSQ